MEVAPSALPDRGFLSASPSRCYSGATALAKIRASASLVKFYSGLAFRRLGLIAEIKHALLAALEDDGQDSLKGFLGADAAAVTAEPWPK
jgi:dihydroorotate dehydrogenase